MSEWVFPSEEGTPLDAANLRKVFAKVLKKAGLRQIRFHDLRHTFASWLIANGESLAYVKDQMGHHSIQITVDTYGNLIPGCEPGGGQSAGPDGRKSATYTQPNKGVICYP